MKKRTLTLLVFPISFLFSFIVHAQQDSLSHLFSVEGDVNNSFYMNDFYKFYDDYVNLGGDIFIADYVLFPKVKLGIGYYQKNIYTKVNSFPKRSIYRSLDYLSLTFLRAFRKSLVNKKVNFILGVSFIKIISYNVYIDYYNGLFYDGKGNIENGHLGIVLLSGFTFSKHITNNVLFNFRPTFNYKILPEYSEQRPSDLSIPEDKFFVTLNIGVEVLFYKKIILNYL